MDDVNPLLPQLLQQAADYFMEQEDESVVDRISIHINSGCRCPQHNEDEKGSKNSRHMRGEAADFRFKYVMKERNSKGRFKTMPVSPTAIANYLDKKYPTQYGIGWYNGRTHFDVSKSGRRRWDVR
jgi:hypothetical protein